MLAVVHDYDPEAVFVIFSIYLDESGSDKDGRLVVGGMAGRHYGWGFWEREIKTLQDKTGIKRLRTVDLFDELKKNLPHLNNDELASLKNHLVGKFAELALRELEFPLYGVLDRRDYRSHYIRNGFPRGVVPFSEYAICLQYCIAAAVTMIVGEYGERVTSIHFIVEAGGASKDEIFESYKLYRDTADPKVRELMASTIGIEDNSNKSSRPLFAADVVANHSLKTENRQVGKIKFTRPGSKRAQSLGKNKILKLNINKTALTTARRQLIRLGRL